MIKGIDQFRAHFAGHEESYALIGGAACDLLFGDAGLPFRATKDFDMVLCVEIVESAFANMFASFLEAGGYQARERSTGQREFYRFHRPSDDAYPAMIELFARKPDVFDLPGVSELTPIPVEEDVISLSAIILDDEYYEVLQDARRTLDGISLVDATVLIPFKARAFLDLTDRKAKGGTVDERHIKKHRADVFRLVQLLPGAGEKLLPKPLRDDLRRFLAATQADVKFSYDALRLPIPLVEAARILNRYYQLR